MPKINKFVFRYIEDIRKDFPDKIEKMLRQEPMVFKCENCDTRLPTQTISSISRARTVTCPNSACKEKTQFDYTPLRKYLKKGRIEI